MASGSIAIIAERKSIGLLEISRSLKVRNFFAQEIVIVLGRMKIYVVVKMHRIGLPAIMFIDGC